jgi:branched-chain amino acid transport system substrate-binding protein
VPLVADIEKVVYGAGKGNLQDTSKIGTILYNRGVSVAVLSVEAIRKAQEKYGKGKAMTGEQVRWAMENLDISNARLQQIGATDLLPEIKTSCDNHEGSGQVKIQQWDGTKWVVVSDWIEGNKALIHPLFKASAQQYAKEKSITPRDCSKEK